MQGMVASKDDWIAARVALLEREKAHTRERDALAAARRQLPGLKIDKEYRFEGPEGEASLSDLFGDRAQLMLYHFMFGADWDEGCPSCSFWADNFNGIDVHLAHRDVRFALVSTAPFEKLEAYRKRMGWDLTWVSCAGGDFNRDMDVSFSREEIDAGDAFYNFRNGGFPSTEAPGLSCFLKRDGEVILTYAAYGRGLDGFNGAYQMLDLAPNGRDEDDLPWPMAWIRRRDQYD